MNQEQIKKILDNAPEGATHYLTHPEPIFKYAMNNNGVFSYFDEDNGEWNTYLLEIQIEHMRGSISLSDLRAQLEPEPEQEWKNGDACNVKGEEAIWIATDYIDDSQSIVALHVDGCGFVDLKFAANEFIRKPETEAERLAREREEKCMQIFERSTGRYWKRADQDERDITEQFLDYIELNGGKLPEPTND